MIIIKELHGGRFGNKILHYNNLAQIAKELNTEHYIPRHDDYEIFNNSPKLNLFTQHTNVYDLSKKYKNFVIDKKRIIFDKHAYIEELKSKVKEEYLLILEPCLGELFFLFDNSTRKIFNNIKFINDENDLIYDKKHCSIQMRGGDFKKWNIQSILPSEYYLNSIEEVKDKVDGFTIHTDDETLESYQKVKEYLTEKGLLFKFINPLYNLFEQDFSDMLYSDYIISSPSTFAISAGFMGKKKEIIHSQKWVDSRYEKDDMFWVGVKNGGNKNYKIYKLI
jgi:hypothetical protein